MEHSTLTLDLSSDDDEECLRKWEDKGKENVAPEDYTYSQSSLSTPRSISTVEAPKTQGRRRKIVKEDAMDDGERSPLSDLETEDFFAAGLDKDSVVVIPDTVENEEAAADVPSIEVVDAAQKESKNEEREGVDEEKRVKALLAITSAPIQAETDKTPVLSPTVVIKNDVEGEIVIWEEA